MNGIIYIATNKANGKVYVGQTTTLLEERWQSHIKSAKYGKHRKSPFHGALAKYGAENFSIRVYATADTQESLNELEKSAIVALRATEKSIGYNLLEGGQTCPALLPEVQEKIRKTLTGRKASVETRLKQSLARMGYKHSVVTKRKIARAKKGQMHSEETRRQQSLIALRRDPETRTWSEEAKKNHVASLLGHKDFNTAESHKRQAESLRRTLEQKWLKTVAWG
jgi:group I intron endonuclease